MTSLSARIAGHAADRPLALALRDGHGELTWAALDSQVDAWCGALLAAGATPGEPTMLWLPKGRAVLLAHLACLRVGVISLPVNPRATANELGHVLGDARPTLVLYDPANEDALARGIAAADHAPARLPCAPHGDAPDPADDCDSPVDLDAPSRATPATGSAARGHDAPLPDELSTAALIYTSGTTGKPKGAKLSHANLDAQMACLLEAWQVSAEDTLLHVLPLFHVHGLFVAAHTLLAAGGTLLLRDGFDAARTWSDLATGHVTLFMGVPTIHQRLLDSAPSPTPSLPALRLVTSGSAPLAAATMERFADVTGHVPLERYGLTEAGMLCGNPLEGPRRAGTVGLALPGVDIRLIDLETGRPPAPGTEGEVRARSAQIFSGYLQRSEADREAFDEQGWFRTGDIGWLDDHGHLVLSGRIKELILVGGFNVYPAEVEGVLLSDPDVAEVAVFGIPHGDLGEVPAAAVVVRPGHPTPPTERLAALCRDQLAAYKSPRRFVVLETLPRNAMGKLVRGQLAAATGLD